MLVSLPITPAELQQPGVLRSQRREWKVERAGWIVFGLLLAGAMVGVFGGGPLAHASSAAGSARLEFDRLVRHGVVTRLTLELGPDQVVERRVRVSLDWGYLKKVDLRDVIPEPLSAVSSPEGITWEFAAGEGGSTIVLEIEPKHSGRREGQLTVGANTILGFRQFVYP